MWLKDTSFSTMSLTDNLFVTSRKGFHKDEGRLFTQTLQEMTHLPWLLPARALPVVLAGENTDIDPDVC